ncbi:ribosome maturation factor RimM [Knoellia locipacati]|uniref:ribosome maturation factor RimM n=1 Tax=Knoellia locipacati TaxID=882824 RepID=UPI00384A71B0
MARSTDSLLVARIGRPHGLRGEVTVQTHTDDPERRYVPGTVYATEAAPGTGVPRVLTLATARKHRETWLLGFEEIPDRTGAESLRGTRLLLDLDEVDDTEDDDDGWYEHDLVGLAVHDPSGAVLGEVTGLTVGSVQDLLEVRLTDGREALVPFVEAIVTEVDIEAGHVVVDAPAGLFDLDES